MRGDGAILILPSLLGDMNMAYFVTLPLEDEHWLDPEFKGGRSDLKVDMLVPRGHLARGVNLEGCLMYHVRVPPELIASVPSCIAVTPRKDGYLPDFGIAPWGGWKLVSESFVELVERLEPGIHEFLPIAETVDRKGNDLGKRFFLMNILQQFDAVDVERSSVEINEKIYLLTDVNGAQREASVRTMSLKAPYMLVLKRSLTIGRHLWHGSNGSIYHIFFSQELHDAVRAAKLSPLNYSPAQEV